MSKFIDYGDSGTNTSDEFNIGGEERWFNIHGTDDSIGGIKLSFWLWGESEDKIRSLCKQKDIVDITKIIQKDPPFL